MRRIGDILQSLLAEVDKLGGDCSARMPPHVSGDAYSARRGEPLEPRRYIDAVPVNIVGRHDDVAEIDADAELDATVLRQPGIARPKRVLHIERAAHRVDDAAELDESP